MTGLHATPSHNAYTSSPPTAKEKDDVELLVSMMDSNIEHDIVLSVLRRNWGDVQKAASALLEGDTGVAPPSYDTFPATFGQDDRIHTAGPKTPPPSKPERGSPGVIDLTAGDEELSQALHASLNETAPVFGPSNRAPDPNWAMVSSNAAVGPSNNQANDTHDEDMRRALEASLMATGVSLDVYEDLPLEQRVRKGDRPVTLRPTLGSRVCAALITHGLFFVPQVRHYLSQYRPVPAHIEEAAEDEAIEILPPREGKALVAWSLVETFVNMDLARTTELNVDQAMDAFEATSWSGPAEQPGDVAYQFYNNIAWMVEQALQEYYGSPEDAHRLLHFRYGISNTQPPTGPLDKKYDMSVVKVAVRGTPNANDLLSCLSLELSPITEDQGRQQVIFQPSEVVAFQLLRDSIVPSSDRRTFSFPSSVYLDQFLQENSRLSSDKQKLQRELFTQIDQMKERKDQLRWHEGRDVLQDLRSSLHYYENIVEHNDDEVRKGHLQDMAIRLRKILMRIENELQTIDAEIAKQQTAAANVYNCPELQKYRYDLRVVLVHDGLYGRSHVYSYVKRGQWWKIVDYSTTEVSEETVLTDSTGLHFNAGPFFLIYSRAISEQEEAMKVEWPENVKNSVKYNNAAFFASLPPEIARDLEDPNSPPTSPPPEYPDIDPNEQQPEEEPMDLST